MTGNFWPDLLSTNTETETCFYRYLILSIYITYNNKYMYDYFEYLKLSSQSIEIDKNISYNTFNWNIQSFYASKPWNTFYIRMEANKDTKCQVCEKKSKRKADLINHIRKGYWIINMLLKGSIANAKTSRYTYRREVLWKSKQL